VDNPDTLNEKRFNPWLHEFYSHFTPTPGEEGEIQSVVFLIGSPDISGGTYVIFQHALWLQRRGVRVAVVPLFPLSAASKGWHDALGELRFTTIDQIKSEDFDFAIATWWPTVYELPKVKFRHAVYLVQSAEARFLVDGEDISSAGMAELSYTFGLPIITIATWLQIYFAFQHQTPSFLVPNGIDKEHFGSSGKRKAELPKNGLRVLVEGSIDAPMKGVADAVAVAREAGCEEIWLLTPSDISSYRGCDRVFSRIPSRETAEVYRSCHVLLKMSHVEGMYGPPLEMFHCGGTVVTYDVTGHDEYVRHESNGLVVPVGDTQGAVAALARLRQDRALLDELRTNAISTAAAWPDWESSSEQFWRVLSGIHKQPPAELLHSMLAIAGAWSVHELIHGE
jgi:glycosyltransferase involved in cell wall biosynthesis